MPRMRFEPTIPAFARTRTCHALYRAATVIDPVWLYGIIIRKIKIKLSRPWNTRVNYLTPWSWVLLEKPPVAQLFKNFPHFMEPESLLPCSQEPSLIAILSQINPVHTASSCLSKIEILGYQIILFMNVIMRNFFALSVVAQEFV
jgi:hypothetical protein